MARVLIIEDDIPILEMLCEVFAKEGFEVMGAPNGKKGMRLQNENPADVIITDIIMPEKEGIETISEIKSNFPETKVIAMSGGGFVGPGEYLDVAKKLGATLTFKKPFAIKTLITAVNGLLE